MFLLISCGSTVKITTDKPLYEVLTRQEDGGATIRFFEILSEEKEIRMLQNDELLKSKITPTDLNTANFVILNMGEKNTLGYKIDIDKVEETTDQILIKVRDIDPKSSATPDADIFYYPYTIVKINSKKPIVIQ